MKKSKFTESQIIGYLRRMEQAGKELMQWIRKVHEAGNEYFQSVADAMMNHWDNILNYFNNRSTYAHAESLNAQIKLFRANLRGVTDTKYFLYRL